jgi:hypothetical protein
MKKTNNSGLGSFADFRQKEADDLTGPAGQELFRCRKLANYNIVNDGTIEELHYKIDLILQEL